MKLMRGMLDLLMAGFLLALTLLSLPKLWGYEIYTVTSGSMEPAIHTGDAIYVKQDAKRELSVGDIVTYSLNEGKTLVTHRVTAVDEAQGLVQTRGDANEEADGWIRRSSVLGTVQCSIRGLGYLGSMLSMTSGRLFCLAVFLWMAAAQLVTSHILQLQGSEKRAQDKTLIEPVRAMQDLWCGLTGKRRV